MFSLPILLTFIVSALAFTLVPGITVSTMISTALARGAIATLWLEMGAQLGRLSMVVLIAVALQAVTAAVSAAFDVIKYVGAAYLLWLGWGYITQRHKISLDRQEAPASPLRQVVSGFLIIWSNPKALIFFGAFLPQFVNPHYPAWPQVLILGLIEMAAALITDSGYILVASFARGALTESRVGVVNRVAGVILIGAAVWLALQHQA